MDRYDENLPVTFKCLSLQLECSESEKPTLCIKTLLTLVFYRLASSPVALEAFTVRMTVRISDCSLRWLLKVKLLICCWKNDKGLKGVE